MKYFISILLIVFSFSALAQKPSYFITGRPIYQSNDTVTIEIKANLWSYDTRCPYAKLDGISDTISGNIIRANLYYELPTIVDAASYPQYCATTDTTILANINSSINQIELNLYTYQVLDSNIIDTTNENSKWIIFLPLTIETKQADKSSIYIYPNPSKSELSVNVQFNKEIREAKVLVYNAVGEVIYIKSYPVTAGVLKTNINTAKLPSGVYTLQVNTARNVQKKQFVIQ